MPGSSSTIRSVVISASSSVTRPSISSATLRKTVRADAVAEGHVRVLADVFLDPVPVVRVVANRFAVRANRQQSGELSDVPERRLQLADLIGESFLQVEDARAGVQPRAKLVERRTA